MKDFIGIWTSIAFVFGLLLLASPATYAKGGVAVAARAAPVSSARSYSAPTPIRTYSSTPKSTYVPTTTTTARKRKDDDVECSTLRNSRYAADREVYRRYC